MSDEASERPIYATRASEVGVGPELSETRAKNWQQQNQEAIKAWNAHAEQQGLPLAQFRSF